MTLNIVEASIADLQRALQTGAITSVELLAKYLLRISSYDCRGPCLNSIPILNPEAFAEAAASDARRAAGQVKGPLDGIPYTLKDSMKYKGQTCATGSPAFKDVVANEDSFVAEQLRNAGAVCVGRTNTPPMMASGMHRGVYGRAESPYSLDYLTAAFSSGSSNGSATSTAASFAAFGLGTETVSSGRSPASNNALVAYTPSRNVISGRGIWPLYPTCDVLVPHARTVADMLHILDVLTVPDAKGDGEFWRAQKFVDIPSVDLPSAFPSIAEEAELSLRGKRIAVPKMYIGLEDPKAKPTVVSEDVIQLWRQARSDLEALGATIIETDFPLVTNYEDDSISGQANNVVGFKPDWNGKERGELVAYLWDDFLAENGDPACSTLTDVDGANIFPRPQGYIPDRFAELKNFMDYPGLVELARRRNGKSIWAIDGMAEALPALEAQRKRDLEDWMAQHGYDAVVFPANGDVGRADVDTNEDSARHALQWGVKYSNGNRAIRHMGVPTVSVSMGKMASSQMPVNLTFAGGHGSDAALLRFACAFERHTRHRYAPPVTPALASDSIEETPAASTDDRREPPKLNITTAERSDATKVRIRGQVSCGGPTSSSSGGDKVDTLTANLSLEVFVDGKAVPEDVVKLDDEGHFDMNLDFKPFAPPNPMYGGVGLVVGNVLVVILARAPTSATGTLLQIDQNGPIL